MPGSARLGTFLYSFCTQAGSVQFGTRFAVTRPVAMQTCVAEQLRSRPSSLNAQDQLGLDPHATLDRQLISDPVLHGA